MAGSEGRARPSGSGGYPVPAAGTHRSEETIGKSRFVASIGRAGSPGEAKAFIEAVRAELPSATHHCWAYNAGPPGDTAHVGLSDAGEPRGSAGRPILDVLSNSGVGEITAVVTRYFGGVKLGERRPRAGVCRRRAGRARESRDGPVRPVGVGVDPDTVRCGGPGLPSTREDRGGAGGESYASDLTIAARVPRAELARLLAGVAEITSGAGVVRVLDGPQ